MVAIKNIRDMHAVSTNQIADILHFNDKTHLTIVMGRTIFGKSQSKFLKFWSGELYKSQGI